MKDPVFLPDDRQAAMMSVVYNDDSDALAKALPYARTYGVSLDFAKENEQSFAEDYAAERARKDLETFKASPYLRKYIEDPDNYRLVKDDSETLSAIGATFQSIPAGALKGAGMTVEGLAYQGEGLEYLTRNSMNPMTRFMGSAAKLSAPGFKRLGQGIQSAGDYISPETENFGTMVGEGLGQLGPQVAMTALNPVYGGMMMFSQGAAQQGRQAEEKGATEGQEALAVGLGGMTTYATEKIPVGMILNKTGLDDVLKKRGPEAVKKLAEQYLKSPAFKKTFDIAGTGLAEGTQEYVENIIQNAIAKGIYDPEAELFPEGLGVQSAAAGTSAAILRTVVLGMMGVKGSSVSSDINESAKAQSKLVTDVASLAKSGNLVNRSPEELAKVVQGMADENGGSTVYIPSEKMAEFFQVAGAQAFDTFKGYVPQAGSLDDILAHGGDVAIPTGNIVAALAADEQFSGLAEFIRMQPEFDPDAADASLIPDDGDIEAMNLGLSEAEQVFEKVYNQFVNAGETPDAARLQATLVKEAYSGLTQRYGDNTEVQARLDELVASLSVQREINKNVRSSLEKQYGSLFAAVKEAQVYFKKQEAEDVARQEREKKRKSLGFFATEKKEKRESKPTPIISWLESRGGLKRGGKAHEELEAIGITGKSHSRLYRKDGRYGDIDNLPLEEFREAFPHVEAKSDDGTYVDRGWLLEALRDESFGNSPAMPIEVRERDQQIRNFEMLRDELGRAGIDLTETDPGKIVKAIQPDADVPVMTLNQPMNADVDLNRKVEIVDLTGLKNVRNSDLKALLQGLAAQEKTIPSADQKRLIKILPKKVRHIVYSSIPQEFKKGHDLRKKAVLKIEDLLANAVLIESVPNRKKTEKPNIARYHRFYVPVRVGDKIHTIRIVTEQTTDGLKYTPNEFDLYDVIPEKKSPSAVTAEAALKGDARGTDVPIKAEGDKITIRQMLSGVKDTAGKPYVLYQSDAPQKIDTPEFKKWFGDSKVVDEDGKPLVVYHGTKEAFEAFDLNKLGRNGMSLGAGFYFSNSKELASGYGAPMAVYLSAQNPTLSIDKKTITKAQVKKIIAALEKIDADFLSNYGDISYEGHGKVLNSAVMDIYDTSENDADVITTIINIGGIDRDAVMQAVIDSTGKDGFVVHASIAAMGAGESDNVYTVLLPTQIKSVHNRGTFDSEDPRILYQDDDPRGRIELYATGQAVITLMKGANRSTALHELAHWFSFVYQELAPLDPRMAKEWEAVKKWTGATGDKLTVEQEEKFARGFEAWLGEGNAPSAELEPAFRRFMSWILGAYRIMIKNRAELERTLDVKLDDDIRDFFSRILATDSQIEEMKGRVEYRADEAVLEMLTGPQKKRYLNTVERETNEAKEELLRKALRQKYRESKQFYKEERAKLKDEMAAQVNSSNLYRAMEFLKNGKFHEGDNAPAPEAFKLDENVVKAMMGKDAGKLSSMSGDGLHPDMVAEMFGFPSGKVMMEAFINAENRQKLINRLTDEEMKSRHGDMLNDGTIEREAAEAFENEWAVKRLEIEGRAAAEAAKIPFPKGANIKSEAGKRIDDKNIVDAQQSMRFHLSLRRAAREFGKALGDKNWIKAAEWKQKQMLSHFLYKESLKAKDFVEGHFESWSKLRRKDEKISASMDMNYVTIARALLAQAGVMEFKQDTKQYLANIEADDPDAAEDIRRLIAENPAKNWKTMSYGEFRAFADTVDAIVELGKMSKSVVIDGERILLDTISQELRGKLQELPASGINEGIDSGRMDDVKTSLLGFGALTRRIESWVKWADGGYAGPWRKYVWNLIDDARGNYLTARGESFAKIRDVLAPHADRINNSGKIFAPEIGETFPSKAKLIGALLHTGNESSFDKLLRGYKWPAENWSVMIDRMQKDGTLTKEDYDLVQEIWGIAESLKRPAWKAHKEIYGFYPEEVQPMEFETPFGTYKGGYWPANPDHSKTEDAAIRKERDDLLSENNSFMFPTTGRGFTKGRVQGYAAPLSLELSLLTQHVDKVLRFTHLQPAVRTVGRILRRKDVRSDLRRINPMIARNAMIPWLQRVAAQSVEAKGHPHLQGLNDAARWLRNVSSMQIMMLNVSNALQQVTGVLPSMQQVGKRNFARAFARYSKNPLKTTKEIHSLSVFMKYRQSVLADEVRQEVFDVIKNRSKAQKVGDQARKHGYIFQRVMQHMVDVPTWMAAYERAIDGKVDGIKAGDQKEAVRHADSVVRETQGSSSPEDVSAIEAQTAGARLFTMFYSYFNMVGNALQTESSLIKRSGKNVRGRQFYLFLMYMALPSIIADIISKGMRGDLPDDDDEDGSVLDDWLAFLAMSPVRGTVAMVPYAGQLANSLIGKFTDQVYDDRITVSPVVSTVDKAVRGPFELYDAMTDDGDLSRAANDMMTTLGVATGLPLGQLGKPAGYVADVVEGDVEIENPIQPLRGILGGPVPASRQ